MGYYKELDIRIRNGGDDAIAAVSELMPRWIAVEEQLPQRGQMVIVAFRGHWGGKRQVSAEVFWIDDRGGWTGCDSMKDGKPTHWMPLPEPPVRY
jgi:hypothetical protein